MKILIVSGFLGAGKTTFIKRLARNVDQRFAILENEYGAAGIDGARLGQNRQGTQKNVWEMTEQCICCIGKKDFAASVLTIANVVDPEYLIVEPTGVGSLARIIENLRQIEYEENSASLAGHYCGCLQLRPLSRNIRSFIRIRSEARVRSLFPKRKHARRKKNSASRNFCRKLTRRQKSSRIMHPR